MCVIIVAPKGHNIPLENIRRANCSNPDGWGIALRSKVGRIDVRRGFSTADLLAAYKEFAGKGDIVVHCRIATSGEIDFDNTHPYALTVGGINHAMVFHNGILNDVVYTDKAKSDTWHFVQTVAKALPEFVGGLENTELIAQITANAIKNSSRFVVMPIVGSMRIYNAGSGKYDGKVWYSNTSAFPYVTPPKCATVYVKPTDLKPVLSKAQRRSQRHLASVLSKD